MQFQDELAGGIVLIRPALRSPNFVTGSTGWSIDVDGSAEFNNIVIRGGTTTQGQIFVYNGTPAAGNMILSISSTAGTDSFGNAFPQGEGLYGTAGKITIYDGSGNEQLFINGTSGILMSGTSGNGSQLSPAGVLSLGTSAFTTPGSVFAGANGLEMVSPKDSSGTTDAETRLRLAPGDGDGSPHATARLGVTTASVDTDFTVTGSITSDPFDTASPGFVADLPSGATADLLDLKVNGTTKMQVTAGGSLTTQNMDWGTAQTPAPGVGGGTSTVSVSFGQTFPNTPRVVVQCRTTTDPATVTIDWRTDNITTTGFDIRAYRSTDAATNFDWFAVSD